MKNADAPAARDLRKDLKRYLHAYQSTARIPIETIAIHLNAPPHAIKQALQDLVNNADVKGRLETTDFIVSPTTKPPKPQKTSTLSRWLSRIPLWVRLPLILGIVPAILFMIWVQEEGFLLLFQSGLFVPLLIVGTIGVIIYFIYSVATYKD